MRQQLHPRRASVIDRVGFVRGETRDGARDGARHFFIFVRPTHSLDVVARGRVRRRIEFARGEVPESRRDREQLRRHGSYTFRLDGSALQVNLHAPFFAQVFPVETAEPPTRARAFFVVQERDERRLLRDRHEVLYDEVAVKAERVFSDGSAFRERLLFFVSTGVMAHQRGPRVRRVRSTRIRVRRIARREVCRRGPRDTAFVAVAVAVASPLVAPLIAPRGRDARALSAVQVVVQQAHRHVRAARGAAHERRARRWGAHRRSMWPSHAPARGQEPVESDLRPVRAASTGRVRVSLRHRAEGPAGRDTRAEECDDRAERRVPLSLRHLVFTNAAFRKCRHAMHAAHRLARYFGFEKGCLLTVIHTLFAF